MSSNVIHMSESRELAPCELDYCCYYVVGNRTAAAAGTAGIVM